LQLQSCKPCWFSWSSWVWVDPVAGPAQTQCGVARRPWHAVRGPCAHVGRRAPFTGGRFACPAGLYALANADFRDAASSCCMLHCGVQAVPVQGACSHAWEILHVVVQCQVPSIAGLHMRCALYQIANRHGVQHGSPSAGNSWAVPVVSSSTGAVLRGWLQCAKR
jgi:hypothetical protein